MPIKEDFSKRKAQVKDTSIDQNGAIHDAFINLREARDLLAVIEVGSDNYQKQILQL